jgi:hypothetical protein
MHRWKANCPRARRTHSTDEIVETEINVEQMMKEEVPEVKWAVISHLGSINPLSHNSQPLPLHAHLFVICHKI